MMPRRSILSRQHHPRRRAAQPDRSKLVSGEMRNHHGHDLGRSGNGADKSNPEGHMRNIVNEDGEIIAQATKDGTLVGGHHRILVAGSHDQKLFWRDTGEPVKLDAIMRLNSHRHIA
jgi:hypothetical protein